VYYRNTKFIILQKGLCMINPNEAISPVAGVILAAGAASRMGQSKLLLPWKGRALICHAARTAIEAGLEPVIVVTGSKAAEIQTALADMDVQLIYNADWQTGQSTSVRTGIKALTKRTEAVIFLLGDQPFVSSDLIQALVETYIQSRPAILAPFVGEKRANPILFDRSVFDILLRLQGDAGARSVFAKHAPTPMPWPDEKLLLDVDTPEDYQRLIGSFP
jgi:molybdenum cofactor cytidylyltransferase